jgi:hypothetical protein
MILLIRPECHSFSRPSLRPFSIWRNIKSNSSNSRNTKGRRNLSRQTDIPSSSNSLLYQSANAADTTDTAGNNAHPYYASELTSFKSPPMQLYIEDTDAYGVKYNGNYIRSYERALHQFHAQYNYSNINIDAAEDDQQRQVPLLMQDQDFHLTKVTQHKFKSSPTLGSSYYIVGRLLVDHGNHDSDHSHNADNADDENLQEEMWSLEMLQCTADTDTNSDSRIDKDTPTPAPKPLIYNTAIVTIASSNSSIPTTTSQTNTRTSTTTQPTPIFQDTFTIHRDEFDIHMPNAIPIQTVLNLFERQRSNGLGGPQMLKQMQEEYNLLWVVTSIDDLVIFPYFGNDEVNGNGNDNGNGKGARNAMVKPGMQVMVRSFVKAKRRGMILECQQEVVATFENEKEEFILAQGIVSICAIDSVKGRPTSNIPQHVRDLLLLE